MPLYIYYLDDELDLLEIFIDSFSNENFHITGFNDIDTFKKQVHSSPPDLIFLDYRLPNTTGDEIALGLNASIPKVLITGDLSVKTQTVFSAIIRKPFSTKDVASLLDSV